MNLDKSICQKCPHYANKPATELFVDDENGCYVKPDVFVYCANVVIKKPILPMFAKLSIIAWQGPDSEWTEIPKWCPYILEQALSYD